MVLNVKALRHVHLIGLNNDINIYYIIPKRRDKIIQVPLLIWSLDLKSLRLEYEMLLKLGRMPFSLLISLSNTNPD